MSEIVRINEFSNVRRGASPRPIEDPSFFGGNVGWVRISDVTASKKYLRKTEQYLSPKGVAASVLVKQGDIVMSICGTVGRPIMVDMDACIHDGFVQIYDIDGVIPEYLYYLLQFHERDFLALGQSGTQTNLNTTLVGGLKVFKPTVKAQETVVKVLASIDEQIESTEKLIEKKKGIKSGLLADLFASPLIRNAPLAQIKDLARDGLFIDGDWVELPHISETGVRFVQTGNIGIGKFINKNQNFIFESSFDKLNCTEVREGDILICRLAEPAGRACLAPKSNERMITSVDVAILRIANPEIRPQYINYALNTQEQLNKVELLAAGSTRKRISRKNLGGMELNVPSIDIQDKMLLTLEAVESEIAQEEFTLEKLKLEKQGLMQDLLTGKVRVN